MTTSVTNYRAKAEDGIVWITGASSGLGYGLALDLAKRGFTVAATARRLPELQALSTDAEKKNYTGKIYPYAGDITNRSEMATLVDTIEMNHGPVAMAVLNAGSHIPDSAATIGGDGFRKTLELNIFGTVNCLEPITARMRERRRGQLVVTASVAGYGGLPRAASYCASKSALITMMQSLRFALAPEGVTVQVINPGFVRTPLTDKNDFEMPFLLDLEDASCRMADGLAKGGFEICFPWQLVLILKFLKFLPYSLYFKLVSLGTKGQV